MQMTTAQQFAVRKHLRRLDGMIDQLRQEARELMIESDIQSEEISRLLVAILRRRIETEGHLEWFHGRFCGCGKV